jgi:hypothetical protein
MTDELPPGVTADNVKAFKRIIARCWVVAGLLIELPLESLDPSVRLGGDLRAGSLSRRLAQERQKDHGGPRGDSRARRGAAGHHDDVAVLGRARAYPQQLRGRASSPSRRSVPRVIQPSRTGGDPTGRRAHRAGALHRGSCAGCSGGCRVNPDGRCEGTDSLLPTRRRSRVIGVVVVRVDKNYRGWDCGVTSALAEATACSPNAGGVGSAAVPPSERSTTK